MVWFQCEDCGESLKKPKLPNHFRICSATKLSCIDCGEIFRQDSVQGHTQCITEAEKYGPKGGKGKIGNVAATPKSNNSNTKEQQPDFDITVGLSDRPPWFCSLCNTKATSKQALLLHADGKKHRAKARAIHAAKQQQTKQTEESVTIEKTTNGDLTDDKHAGEQRGQDALVETETRNLHSKKKRKHDEPGSNVTGKNTAENGMILEENAKAEGNETQLKKAKCNGLKHSNMEDSGSTKENTSKKIKLKKLIKSALRTNADGVLKMKKLKKLVLKSLQQSGITEDETQLNDMLEKKVNTSSRFRVDNKFVHLVAKD